jgi:CheY-like chemotaxis protein
MNKHKLSRPEHHDRLEHFAAERPRILLAEDHAETRALLASMLRGQGYDVVEAASGYEFLSVMSEAWLRRSGRFPDLIVTDVRMPGPNGLRVLEGIRTAYWAIPVIVITAFGDEDTHAEARRLGAQVVIDKPFDLATLRDAVLDVLGGHRQRPR